jgi:soluble lytic murein transglycosylase-like protein
MTPWYRPLIVQTLGMFPAEGLTPDAIEAVVLTESGGLASAYRYEPKYWERYIKGHKSDHLRLMHPRRVAASYGLMQVMYPTGYSLGFRGEPEELFIPQQSLLYGVRLLGEHLQWSQGNLDAALAAYNGGRKGNATHPYRNGHYLALVRKHLAAIQGRSDAGA